MVSPTKQDKGTTRSHLVWQHYLNSFSDEKSIIFIKNKKNGEIFGTSTENVAVSNKLYTLDNKILETELLIFKKIFKLDFNKRDEKFINELIAFLNNDLEYFSHPDDKIFELNKIVIEKIDSNALKRNQEELFTFYEDNFIYLYKSLLDRDSSFYNNLLLDIQKMSQGYLAAAGLKTSNFFHKKSLDLSMRVLNELGINYNHHFFREKLKKTQEDMYTELEKNFSFSNEIYFMPYYFLTFLLTQYLRTSKINNAIINLNNIFKETMQIHEEKIDFKNISILTIHFQAYRLGLNLIFEGFKIIFIINNSKIKFITSDQPVTNIYGFFKSGIEMSNNEFEIYYPLSTDLAILLTKRECYHTVSEIHAYEKDVINYNNVIADAAHKFIYANNKEELYELLHTQKQ